MKIALDMLDTITGWTGPTGAGFTLNNHADYISEYLTASLIIHIPAGSKNQSFTKTITPINVAQCSEIVMSVWSRECRRVNMSTPDDFFYRVQFNAGNVFMMPTNINFESVTFGINGWSSVDRITITPTTDREDWIIISGCYGVWDELPLDVMQGVTLGIQNAITKILPNGVYVGTVTCAAGALSITPSAQTYLGIGAVVTISDGVTSETHQVERFDGTAIWFTSLYDGKTTVYAHAGRSLYLTIPVRYGVMEKEAAIPAISVWGMPSYDVQNRQDTLLVVDSLGPTGAGSYRRMPWMQKVKVLIDCEARYHQILALASRCARMFLASNRVWINGRAHDMEYPEPAAYLEPTDSVVMIPKLQYAIDIEVHEEREFRTWAPAIIGQTLTYTITRGTIDTVEP